MQSTSYSVKRKLIIALYGVGVSLLLITFCAPRENGKQHFTLEEAQRLEEEGWAKVAGILNRIQPPTFRDDTFNILNYGARDDAKFDSRPAILEAIQQCSQQGGGVVLIPSGVFHCAGPIHLKSQVNLHLVQGASLQFSSNPTHYLPPVKVRWEGTVCWNYSPLIYAYRQSNIGLTGPGTIDGLGLDWSKNWRKLQNPDKDRLRQMGNDTIPEDRRVFGNGFLDQNGDGQDDGHGDAQDHFLRPTLIELYECQNLIIEDLTLQNSPFWTVHPVFSKNVTIRNLKIYGGFLNDDGIDPDSCEDLLIESCYIETEDDAISIKAGRDQDAWIRPGSRNIVVRQCTLNSGVNSFCIGSEMSGGVENVFVEDCHILSGRHGLNFKCNLDRGGQVQQIFFRNLTMDTVREAMFIFRMDYHGYRGNHFPTQFNDFYASDIRCHFIEKIPFKIVGVPDQPISRIALRNIEIESAGEPSIFEHAEDVILDKVKVAGELIED